MLQSTSATALVVIVAYGSLTMSQHAHAGLDVHADGSGSGAGDGSGESDGHTFHFVFDMPHHENQELMTIVRKSESTGLHADVAGYRIYRHSHSSTPITLQRTDSGRTFIYAATAVEDRMPFCMILLLDVVCRPGGHPVTITSEGIPANIINAVDLDYADVQMVERPSSFHPMMSVAITVVLTILLLSCWFAWQCRRQRRAISVAPWTLPTTLTYTNSTIPWRAYRPWSSDEIESTSAPASHSDTDMSKLAADREMNE